MMKNYKKELMLKGNAVKRLTKEYQSYDKEVTTLTEKLNTMKESGMDDYEVNKQNDFVQESIGVRNQIRGKLRNTTDELIALINEVEDDATKELEEYTKAQEFVKAATELFENMQE